MKLLAIETSCDETSAAVVEKLNDKIVVHSHVTATSLSMHAKTGGIIPENAAREQVKFIIPVIEQALNESKKENEINWEIAREILQNDIDAIAITYGPGLIGSLLVGVETAKTLAYVFNKPLVPVNHLLAHLYANFLNTNHQPPSTFFPLIGLVVSGGHTDLLHFESHEKYTWLGGTRDDAAGESFDKVGRLLALPYPAGPEIERRASLVEKGDLIFQSPMIYSKDFDFSFSGLKTEVMRYVTGKEISDADKNQICFATQKAILDVLIKKTLNAAREYNCKTILVGGGVSANQTLKKEFDLMIKKQETKINILFPDREYTTDNAAMVGAYALLNYKPVNWIDINANPELYFE